MFRVGSSIKTYDNALRSVTVVNRRLHSLTPQDTLAPGPSQNRSRVGEEHFAVGMHRPVHVNPDTPASGYKALSIVLNVVLNFRICLT
jgi:hypothetical protein